jgi:hypothetical protein
MPAYPTVTLKTKVRYRLSLDHAATRAERMLNVGF